ncbi:MAG TPA: SGNH/GDSL hydrolase family protein [Mobilitalea sp.]|nr:SGNH/GDSL hydrolase family protein [Mobilitalea sp.]
MSEVVSINQKDSSLEGPKAPTDPVKKRSCLYIMMDTTIEATARDEGKPSQEIYLDNERIVSKAKLESGLSDDNIVGLLKDCAGFHELVHSVGVSVKIDDANDTPVNFVLNNWGKEDIYNTGTKLTIPCPRDGAEVIFKIEDYEWSEQDTVIGKFSFEFDNPGQMAVATVKFYLNDDYEVPEITKEPSVEFTSDEYKKMISKSLLSMGNNLRLKTAIEKAKRGEDITIAYIGGSITQGAGAKPIHTGCYAYKSFLKFVELFGKDGGENIHFVKAGVGGTPSELGVIRYDRDILKDGAVEPDIVIVEFAVNDDGDETKGVCFESLCKKILSAANNPAVIILFSVFLDDYNLQDRLAPIGYHYDLPMVSVKDAVVEQFKLTKKKGNIISKKQYFYDVYHPTNDGHTIMSDSLGHLLSETDKATMEQKDINLYKEPLLGDSFSEIHLLDRKDGYAEAVINEGGFTGKDTDLQAVEMNVNPLGTPQFPYNWMRTTSSGKESFRMRVKSKNLIMVFKDSGDPDFGTSDVYVDGKYFKTLNPHHNNWVHCNPVILYQHDICEEHEIEVRMSPDNEDKCFTILGFGYSK